MAKFIVEIVQVYITDGYTNKEKKSFKEKADAIKYAETMNCAYETLNSKSPKEDKFCWEIKVNKIKTIKLFSK